MKRNIIIIIVLFAGIGVLTMASINSPSAAFAKELNNHINEMMSQVDRQSNNNAITQLSSNPYNYARNNVYFDEIVEMGYPAVPLLEDYIVKSPENGLREYLLAIAIEKITKVDLKTDTDKGWYTAKNFVGVWDNHLANIPANVDGILNSEKSDLEKASDIKKLGLPAAPYVMDYIEKSVDENNGIKASLMEILKNSKIVSDFDANTMDFSIWAKENKPQLEDLRLYVESKHQQ
ncbi:MAG: hypothetical protein GX133_09925 [Syntrophomonadaceae bacterium]|nr:hypothetical protein [Syntrophomonadaceae bacterium]